MTWSLCDPRTEVGGMETNAVEFMCLCGYMVVADSKSQFVSCDTRYLSGANGVYEFTIVM